MSDGTSAGADALASVNGAGAPERPRSCRPRRTRHDALARPGSWRSDRLAGGHVRVGHESRLPHHAPKVYVGLVSRRRGCRGGYGDSRRVIAHHPGAARARTASSSRRMGARSTSAATALRRSSVIDTATDRVTGADRGRPQSARARDGARRPAGAGLGVGEPTGPCSSTPRATACVGGGAGGPGRTTAPSAPMGARPGSARSSRAPPRSCKLDRGRQDGGGPRAARQDARARST